MTYLNILQIFEGMGMFFMMMIIFSFLLIFLFWLWALVEVLTSNYGDDVKKLIWVLVIIFVPFGFLLYFIIGRSQRLLK